MENIENRKKKRTVVRQLTTKLLTKIESNFHTETDTLEKFEEKFELLQDLNEQLVEKMKELKLLDSEIELNVDTADLENEVTQSQEYQEKTIVWRGRLQRFLHGTRSVPNTSSVPADVGAASADVVGATPEPSNFLKLPRLQMCTYYGDTCKWLEFWNQFENSIHNNTSLRKTEKFAYLKSLLGGKALDSVSGFTLCDQNYDSSIEILKERFGRTDIVISSHVQKLLSIEPVRNITNVKALRRLYDECEIQIRSLESLKVTAGSYGNLLCPMILQKIPEELNFEFNRSRKSEIEFDIKELISFLRKEINCRESASLINNGSTRNFQRQDYPKTDQRWKNNNFKPRNPSASALSTTMDNKCIFCDQEHWKFKCKELDVKQKRDFLKRTGRCYVCFQPRHLAFKCKNNQFTCRKCPSKNHHESICDKSDVPAISTNENNQTTEISQNSSTKIGSNIMLQTVYAIAEGPRKNCIVRCLIDGGSHISVIREDISKKLQLPISGETFIDLHTFGEEKSKKWRKNKVKVTLRNLKEPEKNITLELIESPVITSAEIRIPDAQIKKQLQIAGISLIEPTDADFWTKDITVLIGAKDMWKICSEEMKRVDENSMVISSLFGWSVHGSFSSADFHTMNVCCNLTTEEKLFTTVEKFWNVDSLGTCYADENSNKDDARALQLFETSITEKEGRYEVRLPWKDQNMTLNNNYEIAERRFLKLINRFSANFNFFSEYKRILEDQEKEGVIEKVNPNTSVSDRIHYIPHSAVVRKNHSSTKMRIIYEANSKGKNQNSLNDCLLQGPHLVPELLNILLNFRMHRIAFTADIQKAFLQISIAPEDRDALRFLWLSENSTLKKPDIQVYRMCRVIFGATSSPFLLSACIKHHLRKFEEVYPVTAELLNKYMYVDDFICGQDKVEDALQVYKEAKEIMKAASMNLTKWKSNSPEISALENNHVDFGSPSCESPSKVLGLLWDTSKDTFSFDVENILNYILSKDTYTKRCILQTASRIFDPLGFLCPYVIQAKILFQELWIAGINWDEVVPVDIQKKWIKWYKQLRDMHNIQVPRWYFYLATESAQELELHCFCDSSMTAYGAVIYVRFTNSEKTGTAFVIAKGRVSPLKKQTLPRLELMAAVVGARLLSTIRVHFPQAGLYLWSDSLIVLHWINNSPRRWKTFVKNRVSEIQEKTSPDMWHHCPGADNPADKITRGVLVSSLATDRVYYEGPPWLSQPKINWPTLVTTDENPSFGTCEESVVNLVNSTEKCVQPVLNIENHSDLRKLLRVTSIVFRFVHNLRSSEKLSGPISKSEIENSMNYWIRTSQSQCFSMELHNLKCNRSLDNHSKLFGLNPFIDDKGILRLKSRLVKSSLDVNEVQPIILPNDYFSRLIVINCHEKVLHSGVYHTLCQVRGKFWIINSRRFIKSILYNCKICKRFNARAGQEVSAPLPADRIERAPPFEVSGVDFAGPLYAKDGSKVYIALFTCAVTRAIHLELVSSLSAECFIQSLRRFFARRGICKTIYSDNAKTFKKADRELKHLYKLCKDESVLNFLEKNGFEWKFNVEGAPWWGGFFERMVRCVKSCLKRILGKSALSFEELYTVLVEVEAVINSRPITFVYNDHNEPDPLSPSNFIIGSRLTVLPSPECKTESTRSELTKRWKHRQLLLEHFWKRFYKEYILELRTAIYSKNPKMSPVFKVNDVVLIREDKIKRCNWKTGRIRKLFPGRDGKVRSCEVQLPNGVIKRPVDRLYNLEVQ